MFILLNLIHCNVKLIIQLPKHYVHLDDLVRRITIIYGLECQLNIIEWNSNVQFVETLPSLNK